MAHFAKLGINGKVIQIVPFEDNRMINADNNEDEEVGRQDLENETGWPLWKQCSFNTHEGVHENASDGKTPLRANFPAIGDVYDEVNNIFYTPRDVGDESWSLNTTTGKFDPPTAMPPYSASTYTDENGDTVKYSYSWNQSTGKWEGFNNDRTTKLAIWNGTGWDSV